jgi:hypothetical protein
MKALLLSLFVATNALAAGTSGFGLQVLVSGEPRPEYDARGNVYIEAIRGSEYALRVTNPTPYRVAVALTVDGLNTVDAKHTDARTASKWVLEPYESTVISGWQVSGESARSFYFTGERDSYGNALGQTQNLGVIEAVFFRERHREVTVIAPRMESQQGAAKDEARKAQREPSASAAAPPSDEYAATGMGDKMQNEVERVNIDLEKTPVASVRIRYEFRPALIKLGVFQRHESPLERREHASGFGSFCPDVAHR